MNHYWSLVLTPSNYLHKDNKNGEYSKVNILTKSWINKIYFTIKVFNYLYVGFNFENVSIEDAETPEAKSLLQHILRYYINAKISTQTHLVHGAGLVWYKDVIPPKMLYFNFQVLQFPRISHHRWYIVYFKHDWCSIQSSWWTPWLSHIKFFSSMEPLLPKV